MNRTKPRYEYARNAMSLCIKPDEATARSLALRATRADLRNHNIVNSTNNCTHPFVEWHCKQAHAFQMRSR